MNPASTSRGSALMWIFAASGFAGLIYESIWTQYLGLILGHSAYAQVLVLALFMGGMALGAWLVSRRSESLKRPLAVYAAVEFLLGLLGIGFHSYFSLASGWAYDVLFPAVSPGPTLETARWLLAGLLILPQCVLLGMTFPLMSAGYLRWQPQTGGQVLAGLYFSNSVGAALGALVSTFVLVPAVGLPGTVLTAGILGIGVSVLVWPLAKLEQTNAVRRHPPEASETASTPILILVVAAVTGASSFVYEVSWIRMLAMVLGSTIHAFEIMLAAFILGIACGGFWLRKRADHFNSPRRAAGWAQLAMGCMALSTLFLYNQSFSWLASVMQTLNRSSESAYTVYNFASAGIAMLIMLPTAFFAGMTLPLLTLTLLKGGAGESAIGKVYAANTLGAIVGVVLAVFVGLPLLGLRLSLWTAAAADIALGIALLIHFSNANDSSLLRRRWMTKFGTTASLTLLGVALLVSHFDTALMSSGVFRVGALPQVEHKVLYYKDGRTASVAVVQAEELRSIITNGKPDAAISVTPGFHSVDEMTMALTGALPMMYHPTAADVAVIGFGSGLTTHTVLGNPRIASVDTIEIEPAMVEGAQLFRPIVERAYTDQRSHIIIDDAKSYFATSGKKYDIIISEPSNPWVSGVASLFTKEFYRFIPKHLNEGGVFAQWVHVYEMTPELIDSVFRALSPHFVDAQVYLLGSATDWVIIASPKRKLPEPGDLDIPKFWDPAALQGIAAQGIASSPDLKAIYLGDLDLLKAYADYRPGVPTNSDYFPFLQLNAPRARFMGASANELAGLKLSKWPVLEVLGTSSELPENYQPSANLTLNLLQGTAIQRARTLYENLLGNTPSSGKVALDLRLMADRLRSAGQGCQLDALGDDAIIMMTKLAAATIPYLSQAESRRLWSHPRWMKCQPQDVRIRDFASLVGAIAARDHRQTLLTGTAVVTTQHKDPLLRTLRPATEYAIGAMQLAAYALGDDRRVLELERQFGGKLGDDFTRTFLVHLAGSRLASAPARN